MEIPLHRPCIHTAYIAEYLYLRYLIFFGEQAFQPSIVRCNASFRHPEKGVPHILLNSTSFHEAFSFSVGAARVEDFLPSQKRWKPQEDQLYTLYMTQKKGIYVYHIQTKHIHNR